MYDDTNPHTNVPPYATHGHGHRQASSDMVVPHAISRAVAHAIRGAGFAGQRALSAAGPGTGPGGRSGGPRYPRREVCKVRRVESD